MTWALRPDSSVCEKATSEVAAACGVGGDPHLILHPHLRCAAFPPRVFFHGPLSVDLEWGGGVPGGRSGGSEVRRVIAAGVAPRVYVVVER